MSKESSRRSMPVEITTSNALISCDGLGGYDWSDQAEKGPNYALMAYSSSSSDSEVSNDSTCSKYCLETVEVLKSLYKQLLKRFEKSELMVVAYKTGLQSVEERLEFYKKNESVYVEKINGLKWDIQILDNCKKGLGYNAVPPPLTGNSMPPKPDLSFTGLEEFTNEPVVLKPVVENSEAKASKAKPKGVDCNYQRVIKPVWNNAKRVNHQNFSKKTHPCPKKNMVPRAVLMKSGLVSVNIARQVNAAHSKTTVNAARPKSHFSKPAHSTVKRPIHNNTSFKNSNFNQRINTVKDKNINAARPKAVVNAARPKLVVNAVKENNVNAVKDLACWVWKPKTKVLDHVSKHDSASITLKKFDYIDAQGRSKCVLIVDAQGHMNRDCLSSHDYEEIDEGYVAFGGNPKGGKITRKCTIKTDHLAKFDGKADKGFFVGYSLNSKAFRVFNSRTMIVEENLHIRFSENTPNVVGSGLDRIFDIDALTRIMNYKPIVAGTQSNGFADLRSSQDDGSKPSSDDEKKVDKDPRKDSESINQEKDDNIEFSDDPICLFVKNISIFDLSSDDQDDGAEADMNNFDTTIQVSPIPTTRIYKDHPLNQVIGDLQLATQTRNMSKNLEEHGFVSTIQQRTTHKDLQNYLFACFLSQEEPKKVIHALKDPSWIEAMQEELLQFKLQEIWTLVDLPNGKRAKGTKWVFRNKTDERGIVIRNKARLVTQGYTQEERIDCDEVFAFVARIGAIRLFLAYASFKDFMVYQMDVKSSFLYGKIEEETTSKLLEPGMKPCQHICWTMGLKEGKLTRPYSSEGTKKLMHEKIHMFSMEELTFFLGLQVQQKKDGIFISQDKYVGEILKKFRFTEVKTASTPMETQKPLLKDEDVCAYARYQVNPKVSHLHAVKRIFRYLKGQPKLGLWYPKDSPFDLVAYTNSDYARASLDRKSTKRGCQFLGCRLISWQCKKQTMVANSITEAEYVAASSCYGQVLWIQNQLLDYGDLQPEDVEGVDCLPNATIFEQLTLIGSRYLHGMCFSSTIASAITCLATNQKFNFSKYIFESMVKNLENVSGKFLMYPRFVQVFLDKKLEGMPSHKRIYVTPSHTKKIFGNMRRVGKGFSGKETHLFPTMVPSTSKPQKKQKIKKSKRKDTEIPQSSGPTDNVAYEVVYEEMDNSLERAATTAIA
ncbi:putative ribonuclease H-like domain-containing protein [Tanacetum coccineum]